MNSSDYQDYIENQERKYGEYRVDEEDMEYRKDGQPLFLRHEFYIFFGLLIVGFVVWYPLISRLVNYWNEK